MASPQGNRWYRIWDSMPTDPKWRTIARKSKQSIGNVIAVYLFVLDNVNSASATKFDDETQVKRNETQCNAEETQRNTVKQGCVKNLCAEDIASALDIESEDVEQILSAMQGKVMEGDLVTGWAKRQPKREDHSTARVKAFREKKKAEKLAQVEATESSETQVKRNETTCNAPEKKRKDKDLKDKTLLCHGDENRQATSEGDLVSGSESPGNTPADPAAGAKPPRTAKPKPKPKGKEYPPEFMKFWEAYPERAGGNPKGEAYSRWEDRRGKGYTPEEMLAGTLRYRAYCEATGIIGTQYVKTASKFLGKDILGFTEGWEIPVAKVKASQPPPPQQVDHPNDMDWGL